VGKTGQQKPMKAVEGSKKESEEDEEEDSKPMLCPNCKQII
jgi:hypothetical protein